MRQLSKRASRAAGIGLLAAAVIIVSVLAILDRKASAVRAVTAADAGFTDAMEYADWQSGSYTSIAVQSGSVSVTGSGVTYDGTDIVINNAGTYVFAGQLPDGSITVRATKVSAVRIVFAGFTLTNSDGPAVNVVKAKSVTISLAPGTDNYLSDGSAYQLTGADDPNATVYSRTDLTFNGTGALTIDAEYNDAVHSTDSLRFLEGTYIITAADDGLIGRDLLAIRDGSYTITSGGDALKTTNNEDAGSGIAYIAGGTFAIAAGDDALQCVASAAIVGGSFTITAGSGAAAGTAGSTAKKSKGLKAEDDLTITGGTFVLDTSDDAIHSNGTLEIASGSFTISAGDDAVHADDSLAVSGGDIYIHTCYEGLEAAVITIDGGDIRLYASDDGINAAGGDSSTTAKVQELLDQYGVASATATPNAMMSTSLGYLFINGGTIYVYANGDGIDSNGAVVQTGGDIIVEGPTDSANGALDYDTGYVMTGGSLLALGSSGMALAISDNSSVYCFEVTYTTIQPAGSQYILKDSAGNSIVSFTSAKAYQNVVYASAKLAAETSYTLADASGDLLTGQLSQIVTSISSDGSAVSGGMSGGPGR